MAHRDVDYVLEGCPHSNTTIAMDGDLRVRVYEYHKIKHPDPEGSRIEIMATSDFVVSKARLTEQSQFFALMFNSRFQERNAPIIELHEDTFITAVSINIWFLALHGGINIETYKVERPEIWSVIMAGEKFGFDREILKGWFNHWYNATKLSARANKIVDAQQLLFPCYAFDHAIGFAKASEYLAYHCSGPISEDNPTTFKELHLPQRVVQQMNAAKGRLRTILHRGLWKPIGGLLGDELYRQRDPFGSDPYQNKWCDCRVSTVFFYQKALVTAKVWPFERAAAQNSIADMLESLDNFHYETTSKDCPDCRQNYNRLVNRAVVETTDYFNGLCLHCMDRTNPKTQTGHEDYWRHNTLEEWDKDCFLKYGLRHGQPTWYFSFMGRRERGQHTLIDPY